MAIMAPVLLVLLVQKIYTIVPLAIGVDVWGANECQGTVVYQEQHGAEPDGWSRATIEDISGTRVHGLFEAGMSDEDCSYYADNYKPVDLNWCQSTMSKLISLQAIPA